ncbi:DUF2339 domain-containing protein [Andreprevotia sp. IGB-42]|uniref:DUF2339 domain-containing protein n=1 Tax=Andreprevotia sp. IGB-42 TaxID=2497473 RepID=UPI00135C0B77|nr:DUF2339 domain-containing protein [Andreprevotia sp. IGB-42]
MWKWVLGIAGLLISLMAGPVWIVAGLLLGMLIDGSKDGRVESLLARIDTLETQARELRDRLHKLEVERFRIRQASPEHARAATTTVPQPQAEPDAVKDAARPASPLADLLPAGATSPAQAATADLPLSLDMAPTALPAATAPQDMLSLPAAEADALAAARNATPAASQPAAASPPAIARPPRKPPAPDLFEQAFAAAKGWLFGGNTVVRMGILILFFGVGFLIKYAADHSMLPVAFRLAGVAVGAIALLVTGWRLRERRRGYALILQGGGVGMLYLTSFGALKLYHLLPPVLAMGLMVALCGLSAFIAIRQDARSLAVMGSIGGFLAPILTSTGGGSHVMLFSYYALLNAGIFAIAWFKAWRPLNLVGFFFTFGIGAAWGVQAYSPGLFASTEPFLLLFFLFYVGIAVLYAARQSSDIKHYIDSTLIFGTPLVGFGFQARLMQDFEFGLAFSAAALSAFYLLLAAWLLRTARGRSRSVAEAFFALGIIFGTLAIPLALDARWTSAAWALEGAAAVWAALRQSRKLALAFGLLLQLAAGVSYGLDSHAVADIAFLNHHCGGLLLALSWLFSAWQLQRDAAAWRQGLSWVYGGLGLLIWLGVLVEELLRLHQGGMVAWLGLATLTAWLASVASSRLTWPAARWPALLLPVVLLCVALANASPYLDGRVTGWWQPLAGMAGLAWLTALASAWYLLYRHDGKAEHALLLMLHAVLGGSAALLLAWQLGAWLDQALPDSDWAISAWAAVLAAALLWLASNAPRWQRWPFPRYLHAYARFAAGFWTLLLLGWCVLATGLAADAQPLPYLPLLNPVDVVMVLTLFALWCWARPLQLALLRDAGQDATGSPPIVASVMAALVFLWLNAVLLRTLHHWGGVPWDIEALGRSALVHTALSIFWSLLALAVMFTATRRAARPVWFVGAALLAVVVVKLFAADLSNLTGVMRIVSFIGVGVLLLLIGYVSPLPPARAAADAPQ